MYHDNDNDGNLGSSKLPLPTVVGKVARSEEMFFKEISTDIYSTFQSVRFIDDWPYFGVMPTIILTIIFNVDVIILNLMIIIIFAT